MPCIDPRDTPAGAYQAGLSEGRGSSCIAEWSEIRRLSKRCQELTQLLCLAGKVHRGEIETPPELVAWFAAHRKMDQEAGR